MLGQERVGVIAYGSSSRGTRRTTSASVIVMLVAFAGTMVLWGRSWLVETEVRWQHHGTHRHFELARGSLTFVSRAGSPSADFLTCVESPDLGYGRSVDWYSTSDPGGGHFYLRLHPVMIPIVATSTIIWVISPARGRRLARASRRA